jgi:lipopolysaccharide export system protein LptC
MNAMPPVAPKQAPVPPSSGHADAIARLSRPRAPVSPRLARPRWGVGVAKWLLPVLALALLSALALWPEIARETDRARLTYRRDAIMPQSGEMTDAAYHGVDERGRPFTMTAAAARQISPERVNLTEPKGDVTLESGNWMLVQSHHGVYLQHLGDLDLSQEVIIYRDDGTTIITDAATVDLKAGAAAGADLVHAEGPFGVLDAQGFALTDKGTAIQFYGPGRLVMNSAHSSGTPAAGGGKSP